jgi:hypothetical protein
LSLSAFRSDTTIDMRDDFREDTKRVLAARAGNRCSNPGCRAPTSGPQVEDRKVLNVGVAAHVTAASAGGARFDGALSADERLSASNGIWLCQTCAKLVDNDPIRFNVDVLRSWRVAGEGSARICDTQLIPGYQNVPTIDRRGVGYAATTPQPRSSHATRTASMMERARGSISLDTRNARQP